MTDQETIAEAVLAAKLLFIRYLEGFTDETGTRQMPNLPNHAVWCLGHCALTMHRAAELIDGKPPSEADFVRGDGSGSDARRFDTESICFDSIPKDDPARYPPLARSIEVFEAACDRLAAAMRESEAAALERVVPWGSGELSLRKLVHRVSFHNAMHAGQITDLRRALGFGRVIR
ncbi:MAG: DinB family protein [Planctomycetes bacterium]|nr:DinB family protein [Planctomycetota bacterium]